MHRPADVGGRAYNVTDGDSRPPLLSSKYRLSSALMALVTSDCVRVWRAGDSRPPLELWNQLLQARRLHRFQLAGTLRC